MPLTTYQRTRRLYLEYIRALRDHAKHNAFGGTSFLQIKSAQRDMAYARRHFGHPQTYQPMQG